MSALTEPMTSVVPDAAANARPVSSYSRDRQRPLRIAYVVNAFGFGGLERCVTHLVNRLDHAFAPLVVSLSESGPAAGWITRDDVPMVELHKRPGHDWELVRSLAKWLRRQRIDIVHSHNWGTLVDTTLARRWAGVPVHVHAERGTICGRTRPGRLRSRLRMATMRWALSRADCVVSNAASVARRLEQSCGFPCDRVKLVPNGIEAPFVADAAGARRDIRRELSIADRAFVVGSVGRLVPVKGFELAVEATARLVAAGCDVHLVLVGDGPERESLAVQARGPGIGGRVHLVGQREDVGRWLAAFDVFVNTSHSEGMSQSIVEAMAAGLPLVVTDVGDNRVLVDGEAACGRVVPAGDAARLAAGVGAILEAPSERARLGRNARERYEQRYTVERMAAEYETLYSQLAASFV